MVRCSAHTTARSDSSAAYMSGLWFLTFPDRSARADTTEASRFSCMLFLDVLGVSDYAGPEADSRSNAGAPCGLPFNFTRSPPGSAFSKLNTQPTDASVYASPAASRRPTQDSRSGWIRYSFPVGLFHPLQHAGLSRRTLTTPLGFRQFRSFQMGAPLA